MDRLRIKCLRVSRNAHVLEVNWSFKRSLCCCLDLAKELTPTQLQSHSRRNNGDYSSLVAPLGFICPMLKSLLHPGNTCLC